MKNQLEIGRKQFEVSHHKKEMDFVNLRTFSRDEVLALFRVPKTVLGITDGTQTRASAETSEYVFMKETIEPKMKKVDAYIRKTRLKMKSQCVPKNHKKKSKVSKKC